MTEQHENQTVPAQYLSLAEKLNGLDLTADEEQALGVLLGAVDPADDDTQGFGWNEGVAAAVGKPQLPVRGFNIGMPPSLKIGMPPATGISMPTDR